VDYSLPADSYSNTVIITATANSYSATPTIISISPNTGEPSGNESITITGTNFTYAYQVFIDLDQDGEQDSGEECTDANIDSSTQITCNTPTITAAQAGAYDVAVKTWGGETKPATNPAANTATTTDDYTYQYPIPTITNPSNSISTAYGTTSGTVTATTNINANCRWSLTNETYTSMGATKDFTTGQNTATHSTTVTGLKSGLNTIYISCANPNDASRFSGNSTTTVTIDAPPPTIQSITTANCPTSETATMDSRDNHHYLVKKMADNKCWMLTNLAYGGSEAGTEFTSGAGSSNTGTTISASSTYWDRTNPPYNNQKQWVNPTTSTVGGAKCATAYRTSSSALNYTECGYLYNWCAALGTASANCNTSTSGTNITNAGVSLCPTGWRLPTGGSTGEFAMLNGMMNGDGGASTATDSTHAANWLSSGVWRGVYSGHFNPGAGLSNQGAGYYWSATAGSSTYAYDLYFSPSTIRLDYTPGKYVGFAVRCVAN
jgi:uncharacterized protein (TIGR02145 family)